MRYVTADKKQICNAQILHALEVRVDLNHLHCLLPRSTWTDPCVASAHTTGRGISIKHLQVIRINI